MLALPDNGIRPSRGSDDGVICDWIEASLIYTQDIVSHTDIVDVLLEESYNRKLWMT